MDHALGQFICQTIDCGKPATLQCPTCQKMGLQPAYFCGQECFKRYWPIHKTYHKQEENNEEDKKKYKFTGPLRPGKISQRLFVPEHISKPDWYYSGVPEEEMKSKLQQLVDIKGPEDVVKMRECAAIARGALDEGHRFVKPGVTTDELDKIVHKYIIDKNAYPSPLNYHNFKKSLCTSVNEVICHGIPDDRPLENGDIVNLDVTAYYKGFHVDLNETYLVGDAVPDSSKYLVEKAYKCLEIAQSICKPGTMYRDLGNIIQKYISENGLAVNRTYCGHGIGNFFHTAPTVPHYAKNKAPGFMKVGHTFTIEPMINQGTHADLLWNFDGWTVVTADGQRSAQFEHTFLITEGGCEVLSQRLPDSPPLNINP